MNLNRAGSAGNLDEPLGRRADSVAYRDLDLRYCEDSARSFEQAMKGGRSRRLPKDPRPTFPPRLRDQGPPVEPGFRDDLFRARQVRGDFSFGEQILNIADDRTSDWATAANGRKIVNKELVLRSKLRIEARRFHMERLQRETWGEKVQHDVKTDIASMTVEERMRKAQEMIEMIAYIKAGGPPKPPPLRYDPTEPDDEPEPEGGIGRRSSR